MSVTTFDKMIHSPCQKLLECEPYRTLCDELMSKVTECFKNFGSLRPSQKEPASTLQGHDIELKAPSVYSFQEVHSPHITITGRDQFVRYATQNYAALLEDPKVLKVFSKLQNYDEQARIEIEERGGLAIFHVKSDDSFDFTFTYEFQTPLTHFTQVEDSRLPPISIEGNEAFTVQVLKDLSKLLEFPSSKKLLTEIQSKTNKPLLFRQDRSNALNLGASSRSADYIIEINHDPVYVIERCCCRANILAKSDTAINLAHELTHTLHLINDSLDLTPDKTIFDNREEKQTIGTIDDIDQQELTENAYRREMGYNPRVGHAGFTENKVDSFSQEALSYYGRGFLESILINHQIAISNFWNEIPSFLI